MREPNSHLTCSAVSTSAGKTQKVVRTLTYLTQKIVGSFESQLQCRFMREQNLEVYFRFPVKTFFPGNP
jgi:hypothetical protein